VGVPASLTALQRGRRRDRGPARRTGIPPRLLGLLGLAGFAVLIEILPRIGVLPARYFPTTTAIFGALVDYAGDSRFWTALGQTLRTW
jgi:ABC-type nitrate/sulfonate/bicarbonate transport system permease component